MRCKNNDSRIHNNNNTFFHRLHYFNGSMVSKQVNNRKENMKLPEYYFCLNDMISSREVEECIIEECESAGLEIIEDEDLAEDRGYDRAFEVSNPYKDKLKKVLEICKTNANKNWEDDFENKAEDEFNEIVKIIERNDNE